MVKIFPFLRLSTKFLAVLRLSVNPIETFLTGRGIFFGNLLIHFKTMFSVVPTFSLIFKLG